MSKSKKARKSKPSNILHSNEKTSLLFWFIAALVVCFLFTSPFYTGLFNGYTAQYETAIYSSILLSSMILCLISIFLFTNWRLNDYRDLLNIAIWLIPLSFLLSIFVAASPHLAKNMTYIHIMYVTFFIAGSYLARNQLTSSIIRLAITISGYLVVLYGFANMFGNAYFRDAVMLTDQGYRLTSVFQYANAYAAFLMAILLCCLYCLVAAKKWYVVLFHGMMLVPIAVSFWLTLSRGAVVTLPIIFLCILPLLPLARQLAFTLYAAIGLFASLPIINSLTKRSTDIVTSVWSTMDLNGKVTTLNWLNIQSLSGWALLLGTAALAALLIVLCQKYVYVWVENKLHIFAENKFSKLVLPAAALFIAVLGAVLLLSSPVKQLLPDTLKERAENINFQQHSVLERATFYKDSMKVIKEYPILGTGGGGWSALYEKYQNNPYLSNQAHNFFLQYLVEVGLIGFLIFTAVLGTVFYLYIRKAFRTGSSENMIFYMVAVSILIHSILDFEMSYVYLGALVFLCLGGMASILEESPSLLSRIHIQGRKRFIYPTAAALFAAVFLVISLTNQQADRAFQASIQLAKEQKPIDQIFKRLDSAIKLRPDHPDYLLQKSSFLYQLYEQTNNVEYYTELRERLAHAYQIEPNNKLLLEQQWKVHLIKQEYSEALELLLKEGLVKYPWEINFYERAIELHFELWNQGREARNEEIMSNHWKAINDLQETVLSKSEYLKTLPKGQMQGRPFYITPHIKFVYGKIYFIQGDVPKALEQLQPAAAEAYNSLTQAATPDEINRYKPIVIWYLAAGIKQGTQDQEMFDKFTKLYPDDVQKIMIISQAAF